MSKPFDDKDEDFESLNIDGDFENVWEDGDEDDFVDISLDGDPGDEEEPHEAVQASARPVRKIEKVIQDPFAEDPEEDDELEEDGPRGSYSGKGGGGHFSGRKNYLILIVVCLVIVAAVVVALRFFRGGSQQDAGSTESTPATTEAPASVWTENGNDAVVQLVSQYYTALKAADMTTLENVLDASSLVDEDTVSQMNSYIEDYQNLVCYTAPGEAEGEYAVYIVYDAKFRNIDTLAPGMTPAYVVTDSAGALRLVTVDYFDDRVLNYMLDISEDETIQALETDVETRYNEALAADASLNSLVNPDGTQPASETTAAPEETTAPTETTAPAETTAAPTETSAETAAPDTTAASSGGDTYTEQTTGMVFQVTDTIMYTTDQVRARTAPTTDGDQFDIVAAGTRIHVTGQSDTWSRVLLPDGDGTYRYIRSDLLTDQEPAAAE